MSVQPWKLGSRLLLAAATFALVAACDSGKKADSVDAIKAAPPPAHAYDNAAWPGSGNAVDPTTVGFTKEGLAVLDARMAKAIADHDVAGAVTMLVKDGELVQLASYGVQSGDPAKGDPMTANSLFRIYSMSKPITGVAMMQLYEAGKWQLDDPVTKYVPELAGLKVLTWKDGKPVIKDGKPVLADMKSPPTMKQLMSHTAGFGYGLCCTDPKMPNYDPVNEAFVKQGVLASKDLDEMMKKIEGIPLLYDPGTKWSYSAAVDIQGYIVQKLSGEKFGDYLKKHVLGPMAMDDTAFYVGAVDKSRFTDVYHWDKDKKTLVKNEDRPDRPGFFDANRLQSGGGGLVSTIHDYARLCQMMLNKGTLGGNTLLKPETVALMTQNHIGDLGVSTDGTLPQGLPGVHFGLDFAIYDDTTLTKQPYGKGTFYWGGAAGTWFWIDPVNNLFFIGMIQQMGGFRPDAMNFRADSAKLVYDALKPAGAAPAAPAAPATTPAPAAPATPAPAPH